jgi:hypothetical protein
MNRHLPNFLHTPPPVLAAVLTILLAVIALVAPTQADANPGRTASNCVSLTRSSTSYSDQIRARNTCRSTIFVIYCGDTAGGGPFCQGSRNSVYYSHTFILRPGATHTVGLRRGGRFNWGACEGTIGFGNEGHFRDSRDGRYTCLRR